MSANLKKEWAGESGYCNCLLVVMSRVPVPRVELCSDQLAPNLEALTPRPETLAWLRAQEFNLAALETRRIIETLAGSAGITKSLWRYKPESSGSINVHDCVETDGPIVERKFNLHLVRSGSTLHLTVVLDTPGQAQQ